jgi:hypothetical protein
MKDKKLKLEAFLQTAARANKERLRTGLSTPQTKDSYRSCSPSLLALGRVEFQRTWTKRDLL